MNVLFWALLAVLLIMSLVTFFVYAHDKRQAKRGGWRVKEKTLILLALLLGAPGAFFAMRMLRHKTLHAKFTVTVPLALVFQLALLGFVAVKAFF